MSFLQWALLASVLLIHSSVAIKPPRPPPVVEPPRTCLQVAELWSNLTGSLESSLFTLPVRQVAREMEELYERAICFPYQLMDSLGWLRRTSPEWVPSPLRDTYATVMRRADAERGPIRTAGLRCQCTDPIQDASELSRGTLEAMLSSILRDEKALAAAAASAQRLIKLIGPDKIILVGNSAVFEKYPVPTGPLIDNFTTVVRFNTEWIEGKVRLVGNRRDVWFSGDYKGACGCASTRCCSPERTAAMWERIGPNVKVYIGPPPPGFDDPSHAHMRFERNFDISLDAISYWLWLRSREHNQIVSPYHPRGRPLRTGFKALLKLLIGGADAPTLAGFDIGDANLHINYFEAVKNPDHAFRKNNLQPQRYHVAEARILGDLHRAGLIRNLVDLVTS